MLYKKFNKDTIYQYYLEHAIKSPQINEFLKSFEVTVDVKEFINIILTVEKTEMKIV
jgi:hypothetical protein